MQSNTTQFPSLIALYKNLGSNFNSSLSSPESEIFCVPIRSEHSKFFVQKQTKDSSILFVFILLLKYLEHHSAT